MENRVNYYERQFLRAEDFRDEQAYHIAMRRRHNIAHHTWGIVRGLELLVEEEGGIFVLPGLAIDGYGRELLLSERYPISPTVFDEMGSDLIDVYLYYGRVESDPPRPGYDECEPGQFARVWERVNLRLARANPEANPRCPREVPAGDHDFNPARRPPDSPLTGWPVFVGQLVRDAAGKMSAVTTGRPYAGLVGEAVHTPSRRARLVLGDSPPADPNTRRFAVFLRAEEDDPCGVVPAPEAQLEIVTRDVRPDQEVLPCWRTRVNVRGQTTVHGNVAITAGTLRLSAEAAEPASAQPWRVYRVKKPEPGGAGNIHEMRVEMPEKPAGGAPSYVTIGAWSSQEKRFMPCLTITNDCRVIVHGKLIAANICKIDEETAAMMLNGAVGVGQEAKPYRAGLTQEARSAVTGMVLSGIAGAISRPFALNRELAAVGGTAVVIDELVERIGDGVVERIASQVATKVVAPPPADATALLANLLALSEAEWESAIKAIYQTQPNLADRALAFRKKMWQTPPEGNVNP